MAIQVGARQQRSYALESGTYATYGAPNNWAGLVQDFTDASERNLMEVRGNNSLEPAQYADLEYNIKGSIDTILQDGRLLTFAFNSGTEDFAAGSKLHLLAVAGSRAFPSASFENANTGNSTMNRSYIGMKFGKISLTHDNRDMLHFKADWVAKTVSGTTNAATSVTANTTAPFVYAQGNISLDGTTIAEVKTAEVNLTVLQDPQFYLTSGASPVLSEIADTGVTNEGTITVGFTDHAMYSRWLGFSGAGVPQVTTSGANIQLIWRKAAGAGSDFIELTLSGCKFKSAQPDGGIEGTLNQTLEFVATTRTARVIDALSGTRYYFA